MSVLKRREIPIFIMVICLAILVIEYYFKIPGVSFWSLEIQRWGTIILGFAMGFGIVTSMRYNIGVIQKGDLVKKIPPLVLIFMFLVTVVLGLGLGTGSSEYAWVFDNVGVAGAATAATLVGFFVISALFRTARLRSYDVLFAIASITFYIFYLTILGDMILPGIMTPFGDFLGTNVIMFGTGFSLSFFGIAMMLRVITGREKAYG